MNANTLANTGTYEIGKLFAKSLGLALLAFVAIGAYRALDEFPTSAVIVGTAIEVSVFGMLIGSILAGVLTQLIELTKIVYYRLRILRISNAKSLAEWLDHADPDIEGLSLNELQDKIRNDIRLNTLTALDLWQVIQIHPRWQTRQVKETGYIAIFLQSSIRSEVSSVHPVCSTIGIGFAKALGLLILFHLLLLTYTTTMDLANQRLVHGTTLEVFFASLLLGGIVFPMVLAFASNLSRAIYGAIRYHWPTR